MRTGTGKARSRARLAGLVQARHMGHMGHDPNKERVCQVSQANHLFFEGL